MNSLMLRSYKHNKWIQKLPDNDNRVVPKWVNGLDNDGTDSRRDRAES